MQRRGLVILVVVIAALLAWVLWPARPEPVTAKPPVGEVSPPQVVARMSTARGAPLISARLTPSQTTRPCLGGKVVDSATGAGVPRAQVTLATERGAIQGSADSAGLFEFTLESGPVALAEVSAEGYFPFLPEWGHFPIELRLEEGQCVSGLVLSLTPRVSYRGIVLSPEGEPVAGASITIATDDEPPGAPLVSDAEGAFGFSAADGAMLVARHPKFAPGAAVVDFRAGVSRELVIKLGKLTPDGGVERATLTGVVVDVRDAGLPGVQVRALQQVTEEGDERVEGTTSSDAEGRFRLDVEGPGPWKLFAQVPGLLSAPVTTHGEPVVLRLLEGTELVGAVRDGAGRPVQSFTVLISHRVGPLRLEGEDARNVVDAEGKFSIKGLAPGPARVVVVALGYAPSAPVDLELSTGRVAAADFRLSEGAKVAGQVIDRKSKAPLEGARVSLEGRVDSTLTAMPSALTDADGGFVLSGVSPGRRSIFFAAARHHARLVSVEAREGETTGPLLIDLGPIEQGEDPRLELVGIGAVLEAKGDALVLKQVMPGGGAAEAGLVAGDGILSIEGQSAATLGFVGGVELIRGPEGTYVKVEVRRVDGTTATMVVPRRRIER